MFDIFCFILTVCLSVCLSLVCYFSCILLLVNNNNKQHYSLHFKMSHNCDEIHLLRQQRLNIRHVSSNLLALGLQLLQNKYQPAVIVTMIQLRLASTTSLRQVQHFISRMLYIVGVSSNQRTMNYFVYSFMQRL